VGDGQDKAIDFVNAARAGEFPGGPPRVAAGSEPTPEDKLANARWQAAQRHPADPTMPLVEKATILVPLDVEPDLYAAIMAEADERGEKIHDTILRLTQERLELQPVTIPATDKRVVSLNTRVLLAFARRAMKPDKDGHTYLTVSDVLRRIQVHRGNRLNAPTIRETVFNLLDVDLVAPAAVPAPRRGPRPLGWRITHKGFDHLAAAGHVFTVTDAVHDTVRVPVRDYSAEPR